MKKIKIATADSHNHDLEENGNRKARKDRKVKVRINYRKREIRSSNHSRIVWRPRKCVSPASGLKEKASSGRKKRKNSFTVALLPWATKTNQRTASNISSFNTLFHTNYLMHFSDEA